MKNRACLTCLMLLALFIISVEVKGQDDHGDTRASATNIGLYSSTVGVLDTSSDLDYFRIELSQFGILEVSTVSNIDTYGKLFGQDGEKLADDDDDGDGRNFLISSGLEPRVVFVEVSGYGGATGSYTLNVQFKSTETRQRSATNLGDFNGDGFDDILLRNLDGRWYYYPMSANGYIADERGFVAITRDLNYGLAGIGDFDGDGKDDVLLRHLDGRFVFYFLNGREVLQVMNHPEDMPTNTGYQVVGIVDLSSYGDTDDIVLRNMIDGDWMTVEMNSWNIGNPSVRTYVYSEVSTDVNNHVMGFGDFDGNGNPDLLLRQRDGKWYYYLFDQYQRVLEEGYLGLNESVEYSFQAIADFNADGKDDILLRHKDGSWQYYAMNGSVIIKEDSGEAHLTEDLGYSLVAVGVIDGDQHADVLLRHTNGIWRYYPMNGRTPLSSEGVVLSIASNLNWVLPLRVYRASIAGQLQVTEGQVLDGDTGDPADPQNPNDNSATAQRVLIPTSIAGYLMEEVDEIDVYSVRLPTRSAKTRFSLVIADGLEADFDIHLADQNGVVVGESLGVGETEYIETTRSGIHQLVVSARNGASNYILVISAELINENSNSSTYTISSDFEFVPYELVVTPWQSGFDSRSHIEQRNFEIGAFNLKYEYKTGFDSTVMRMVDNSSTNRSDLEHLKLEGFIFQHAESKEKSTLLYLRKELLSDGVYSDVVPNYIFSSNRVPNDLFYEYQWHYESIHLPYAWDHTTGDDNVIVAVVDDGILPNHPDISSRVLKVGGKVVGYDFIRDPDSANDGDGLDPDPTDTGEGFHGTHVAGTIGMATNNSRGAAGVTWSGKLLPVRVLGVNGSGSLIDISEGIRFAAGLRNVSGTVPSRRADVINLSLGMSNDYCRPTPNPAAPIRSAIEGAIRAGVVVVQAAGNDNCRHTAPMSKIAGVISVGATDFRNNRAPYSNYGSGIDVVAPGGDYSTDLNDDGYVDGVLSTSADPTDSVPQYNYGFGAGTSMAAPHMSGVVSLMLAVNPDLTPNDVNRLLDGTHTDPGTEAITTDIGISGRDSIYGNGIINALRAVQVARAIRGGGGPLPTEPVLSLSPSHLSFGLTGETLRAKIENIGFGKLSVQSVNADVSWLSVTLDDPMLIVNVDRFGLDDGTHLGSIQVTSNGGTTNISVTMQVQGEAIEDDVGTIYVIVYDAQNLQQRAWGTTNVRIGYSFQLPVVDGGRYLITAGTDRDGDGFICDAGEACGKWPLIDSPSILEVEGSSQIEFGVSIELFARVSSQSFQSMEVPEEGFEIDRSVIGNDPN